MLESSISSPRVPGYSYSSHPQNLLEHHCSHISHIYSLLTSRCVVRHASSVPPLLILPGANESASAFQELWKILGNRSQVGPWLERRYQKRPNNKKITELPSYGLGIGIMLESDRICQQLSLHKPTLSPENTYRLGGFPEKILIPQENNIWQILKQAFPLRNDIFKSKQEWDVKLEQVIGKLACELGKHHWGNINIT